jgi:hypothetical protein
MMLAAPTPIVTRSVRKEIALRIECRTRDRPLNGGESLETLFVVLVPKANDPIAPHSRKGPVLILKGQTIDCIGIVVLSMALESEMVLIGYLLDVLDPNASFDAPDGISGLIGKRRDASCLKFERRFLSGMFLWLSTANIVRDNVSTGRGHYHEIPSDVQIVDAFG